MPSGNLPKKRLAILDAARELFLAQGYSGTSMDQVAAAAAVSKQTVYKHFADKESLFVAVILETVGGIVEPFRAEIEALATTDDLAADLRNLARQYIASVIQPRVLDLRRLVIAEAARLPGLARTYYDGAPGRTIAALAAAFKRLDDRSLIAAPDPDLAASHFAFLVLGQALDRALFCGCDAPPRAELEGLADAGAAAFLAAYAACLHSSVHGPDQAPQGRPAGPRG